MKSYWYNICVRRLPVTISLCRSSAKLICTSLIRGSYQVRQYLVKKNGTFLVLETASTRMDPDPTGLPGLGTGKPRVQTKLSQMRDVKLASRKLWSFTLGKPQKAPKRIGSCMNIAFSNPLAKVEVQSWMIGCCVGFIRRIQVLRRNPCQVFRAENIVLIVHLHHRLLIWKMSLTHCRRLMTGVFALPRTSSLKPMQHEEKINLANLGSGSFDWATLAGLNSLPELLQTYPDASYSNTDVNGVMRPLNATALPHRFINREDGELGRRGGPKWG
ncbi:hypothetical protein OIU84_003025 [Salix udensis]|uniref:Uncharacterized protein n=1 Tax=Salix udensis TaxID=889485 RepID=A0AAD6K7D5_9ROSI|nr:hypothetical protein OIU84_003025 [Salix udensis]